MRKSSLLHGSIHLQTFQVRELLRFGVNAPKGIAPEHQRGRDMQDVIFGRTPMAQGNKGPIGRDHHNKSMSMWLAGTGIQRGITYGATDDLSGGFLGQYMALQETGAPHLTIRAAAGSNMQVVWGSSVPGWVLQSNTTELSPSGWVDVVGTPSVIGPEQILQFAAGSGRVFFRLRKL
jgi:hypothetical protein